MSRCSVFILCISGYLLIRARSVFLQLLPAGFCGPEVLNEIHRIDEKNRAIHVVFSDISGEEGIPHRAVWDIRKSCQLTWRTNSPSAIDWEFVVLNSAFEFFVSAHILYRLCWAYFDFI